MHEPQNHELEWTQPSETQNGFTWILIPEFFPKTICISFGNATFMSKGEWVA